MALLFFAETKTYSKNCNFFPPVPLSFKFCQLLIYQAKNLKLLTTYGQITGRGRPLAPILASKACLCLLFSPPSGLRVHTNWCQLFTQIHLTCIIITLNGFCSFLQPTVSLDHQQQKVVQSNVRSVCHEHH